MSTLTTIKYDTANQNQFVHTPSEVLIDGTMTMVDRALPPNELMYASGRVTKDIDLSVSAVKFAYRRGTALWSMANGYDLTDTSGVGYISMNDDSLRDGSTLLENTAHLNFGAVGRYRWKHKANYTGTPAATRHWIASGRSVAANGLGSLIEVSHLTNGNVSIRTGNAAGTATVSTFGAWNPVIGTEYEIEMSINSNLGSASLYVNEVLIGHAAVRIGVEDRDFLYFGCRYINTIAVNGNCFMRDFQVFNTEALEDADSLPRIVRIKEAIESLVEPQMVSQAEGYVFSADDLTINGDSNIKYVLKIETEYKWVTGGNVQTSDGTYAQANTLNEFNASIGAINTAIGDGVKLTLVPILYSGPLGLYSPSVTFTTLEFDFHALPISCEVCNLYGFVKDNCEDIISGTARIRTTVPIHTQGQTIAFDETVDLDPLNGGYFEMPLVIPNYKSLFPTIEANGRSDTYLVQLKWIDVDGKSWSETNEILVTNQAAMNYTDAIVEN